MTELQIGDKAPDFNAPIDGGDTLSLASLKGHKVVLYFYPKDSTPGCTKQACAFRDNLPDFDGLNAKIVGVSKDSVKKHDNFKTKNDLNFPLISDEDGTICEDYGVWVEKSMYGKKHMGIQRATFLIDANGIIQHIWPKVKVADHIEDVRNVIQSLDQKAA